MAKKLEDILNESDTPVEGGVYPTAVVEESDVSADHVAVAVDPEVAVTAEDTVSAVVEGADDDANSANVRTEKHDTALGCDDIEVSASDAAEDDPMPAEPETCEASEARIIHPRRRVTLYRDAACTKPIGTHSGAIRVLFPDAKNVSLAEYTVVSAGKRITKRAYIHI